MNVSNISYGRQWIDDDDISAVVEVLKGDYLTCGPEVDKFEKAIAERVGAKYCVSVSNGTAALHLAVKALDLESGEGITSAMTFAASANSLLYNDFKPVFADIDPRTYNIDTNDLEKKITDKTKVLIPVHFAGRACDMTKIHKVAQKSGLKVIEDAAHAMGSRYADGSQVGNCRFSDLTIFSFHPVKTITTGEGGAITTNDINLYHKLLKLRSHGITRNPKEFVNDELAITKSYVNPWYHEMQDLGFNYRLTDIQAALGLSQLKKLDFFIKRRQEIVDYYNQELKDVSWLKLPCSDDGTFSAFHLYVVQIDYSKIKINRQQIMQKLSDKKIGTQVHYIPVYYHPYYQKLGYTKGLCPVTEQYYDKALSLPLYPKMSNDDVKRVVEALKSIYGG